MDKTLEMSDAGLPAQSDARQALLLGFRELVLGRRYGEFTVNCITRSAKVARSTFYYHFRSKDDLLLEGLRPFVETLARMVEASGPDAELEGWLAHIWQHRGTAGRLLTGRTGAKIETLLTGTLLRQLSAQAARTGQDAAMMAEQISGATLALLRGWIEHRVSASHQRLAETMQRGAYLLAQRQETTGQKGGQ